MAAPYSSIASELNLVWQSAGSITELPAGLILWHSGELRGEQLRLDEALWLYPDYRPTYDRFAREGSRKCGFQVGAFKSGWQTARSLLLADFNGMSLRPMCDKLNLSHAQMKAGFRRWLAEAGHAGAAGANRDRDELFILDPQRDLIFLGASQIF